MQSRLASGPALVTWVLRCESLPNACARVPDLGEILAMRRGDFRWKIAVPEDGNLPWGGILPAAIQWEPGPDGAPMHPCDRLPDSGCELGELRLAHPAAVLGTAGLVAMFRELRVVGPIDLKPGPVRIAANVRGPAGVVDAVMDSPARDFRGFSRLASSWALAHWSRWLLCLRSTPPRHKRCPDNYDG